MRSFAYGWPSISVNFLQNTASWAFFSAFFGPRLSPGVRNALLAALFSERVHRWPKFSSMPYRRVFLLAIDNNLTRKISGSDPSQIAMLKGLSVGTVSLVIGLVMSGKTPTISALAGAGLLGFLSYLENLTPIGTGTRR
jgi:hypothetical protein